MKDEKTVDMEMSDINCKIQPKKKMTIKDFVWTSKTMKRFTLTIQKAKTEMVNSAVEIGKFWLLKVVHVVPCQLGFTRVCNSAMNTSDSTAFCPDGANVVRGDKCVFSVELKVISGC